LRLQEKSHVEGAASSAVQGMAAATTPEDIMAQLHKLEELGVRLLDPVDNKVSGAACTGRACTVCWDCVLHVGMR
jgi:hypothetical protein